MSTITNRPENRKIFDGGFCQILQTLDKSRFFQYHDSASLVLTKQTISLVLCTPLQWHSAPRSNGIEIGVKAV